MATMPDVVAQAQGKGRKYNYGVRDAEGLGLTTFETYKAAKAFKWALGGEVVVWVRGKWVGEGEMEGWKRKVLEVLG